MGYFSHDTAVIDDGCQIGNGVKIWHFSHIMSDCIIADRCNIGQSAVIRKQSYVSTLVEKGASIGANATIICGNTIGKFALIGAGAVVTKSVKPYALIVGNPGKQIGWVSEFGHRLNFKNGTAICKESNQKYQLFGDHVKKIL